MQGKVKVRKQQLNYFRKLARESSKEIFAYLLGEIVSPTLTRIGKFHYPTEFIEQTESSVRPTTAAWETAKQVAEAQGLRIVGTIHSHPDWVPIMSPSDYKGHIEDGDRVSAIVGKNGQRTRVYFWTVASALPLEIEYVP